MSELPQNLALLADRSGLATEFWDWKGHHIDIPATTIVAALGALGIDATSESAIDAGLAEAEQASWRHPLPPVVVAEQGNPAHFLAHVAAGRPAEVWIELENGRRAEVYQVDNWEPDRPIDGRWVGRAEFALPDWLETGYHQIWLRSDDQLDSTTLIITPRYLGLPNQLGDARIWGYMVQLYSLASKDSWGLGDLTDLADLAYWAKATQGADYILINPLHAAAPVAPMEPSPYLPASRRYVNPIYLRPEAVEEYATLDQPVRRQIADLKRQLVVSLAGEPAVQRDSVWAAKRAGLELIYRAGRRTSRQLAFEHFLDLGGETLARWGLWCALTEEMGSYWTDWDPAYQDPTAPAVQEFAAEHAEVIEFHAWLQWQAEEQLSQAQAKAKAAGMKVGIVTDLAVGVDKHGAETWLLGDAFARGVEVGAPPDAYNQLGQTWGQWPWRPDRLEAGAYQPYRSMVAGLLRHSGGIRVDHIIGLFRLWWIPDGATPQQGTYLRYHHEALVGILLLEAQRAGAIVIGEDLGTVEPWVRDYLRQHGLLGTSVLWFEYDDYGQVRPPEDWRELCLGSVTTHDLPPTAGYLAHDHVSLRHSLGMLTEPLADEIAKDVADQGAIMAQLEQRGLLELDDRDPHRVMLALHRYLLTTRSRVLAVALTDAVGERRTQNQPGTTDEYPNWRVPLSDGSGHRLSLEEIFALPQVGELSQIFNTG